MLAHAADVGGVKVLAERIEGVDAKVLREMLDKIKQKLPVDAVVVLASAQDGKATLIAGVSGAALGRIKAGDIWACGRCGRRQARAAVARTWPRAAVRMCRPCRRPWPG